MDSASEAKADELFRLALAVPIEQRVKFVSEHHFADEPEILSQVLDLLSFDRKSSDWLITAAVRDELRQLAGSERVILETGRQVDRYRIERLLGCGGFGAVYLATDQQLQRQVALKIPHLSICQPNDLQQRMLVEARNLAQLDHPNIVPIFDVGATSDIACYLVSKYIEGGNLADRIRQDRRDVNWIAGVIASLADALDYAHQHGLTHRDVKPANVLIDANQQPMLIDFGLAADLSMPGELSRPVGTPIYMSPEQAAGEGHRVDRRSDIYSLGVVMYELLTGQLPVSASRLADLFELKLTVTPTDPSKRDAKIPPELGRICLKMIAGKPSNRYQTAKNLSADLQLFLRSKHAPAEQPSAPTSILPRGLSAFSRQDAEFYLDLLPGPKDTHGLPESISFWKHQIEEREPDEVQPVGVIYGPSGCGKTSLLKAGILPSLAARIEHVYFDAAAETLESGILVRLKSLVPDLDAGNSLARAVGTLRTLARQRNRKYLIAIDQFEHWLHRGQGYGEGSLLRAMRQADGIHVQFLLVVRDEFWLGISRLFDKLDLNLVDSKNAMLVDLFDKQHTKHVLDRLGRAYGCLPGDSPPSRIDDVLELAETYLSDQGRTAPITLSMFAEMTKR
ncbi:MAG: serine/threonine-protein kinase, partial [Pirellulales bacterium]|nr:serine/threonine-protein kinase [Pirellulales bacterium]